MRNKYFSFYFVFHSQNEKKERKKKYENIEKNRTNEIETKTRENIER